MSFRFLGNKQQLLDPILRVFQSHLPPGAVVADLFAGTASVSRTLREGGYRVIANDVLSSARVHAQAQLLAEPDGQFRNLAARLPATDSGQGRLFSRPYDQVVAFLNALPPEKGFFVQEYSPAGKPKLDVAPRRYFSPENAGRIDAIRGRIREWEGSNLVSTVEVALLKQDLMLAVNRVANIAGTYGHFLKDIQGGALEPLTLRPSVLTSERTDHEIYQEDAAALIRRIRPDGVYIDPPYTKRQYAAYYHVLETVAEGDFPEVVGKSGLRPWESKASDWCYRRKAPDALKQIVEYTSAPVLVMSYSNEGHIPHQQVVEILSSAGTLTVQELDYRRYRSNNGGTAEKRVTERLYVLTRK